MITHSRDADGWPVWPPQDASILDAIGEIFRSGDWGRYQSAIHSRCVAAIADMMSRSAANAEGTPQVRLCSSGSAGIELALRGSGVTTGSEVVVAAYDYPGNFRTIELLGATPVLADVCSDGVTMDPESLRGIDDDRIVAVVVSHLYGELADMVSMRQICDERNWVLIEDACQVPGAGWYVESDFESDGASGSEQPFVPVGSLADAVVLSFGGTKLLSTGNGGAILTRSPRLNARIQAFADRPSDVFAFSPLQCAALLPQLVTLDAYNAIRTESVARLSRWDWASAGVTPISRLMPQQRQAFYKFAVLANHGESKETLRARFQNIGLPCGDGFRSTDGTSDRRSRKPVPLEHSRELGEFCLVIDHRALLADDLIERMS